MASDQQRLYQAVLGLTSPYEVRGWLDRHVNAYLHSGIESVTFQAGDIDAVFGYGSPTAGTSSSRRSAAACSIGSGRWRAASRC